MSDEKEKIPWGFRTTSAELQDRFERLFKEVENKEKEWAEFTEWSLSKGNEIRDKVTTELNIKNLGWLVMIESTTIMALIGQLGEVLGSVEKRVISLEKSIENLHLKVK